MARLTHLDAPPLGAVIDVRSLRLSLSGEKWPFAAARRRAIVESWKERVRENPNLFNGRFFILAEWSLAAGSFEGVCVETDYASYLHWRAASFPGAGWNAFAMPALHALGGELLVGRMAAWTANAGVWYPPAGSLDAEDVTPEGVFDLEGNMRRELAEEIGFAAPGAGFSGPWRLVFSPGRLALFRRLDVPETAEGLGRRFAAFLAGQARPELDAVRFVANAEELAALRTPPFLRTYAAHALAPPCAPLARALPPRDPGPA